MTIQIQGRYAWVLHDGCQRLLHVKPDELGDIKTLPRGGWIAFAQASKSEAQMSYDGIRCGPIGIVEELKSQGIPFEVDEEHAFVLVSVSHFPALMQKLVIRDSIAENNRAQLLLERSIRLHPHKAIPKVTKVKRKMDQKEKPIATLDKNPLPLPTFSVHPGATIDPWGPMLQTAMIHEAFHSLTFHSHDCDLDRESCDHFRVLCVLNVKQSFSITSNYRWPVTNCRMLIAFPLLPNKQSVPRDRRVIPPATPFLVVDNYEYRGVRQITLLVLTETQVPFFLSGIPPQITKLAKKARGDLHQKSSQMNPNGNSSDRNPSTPFASQPEILTPYGDWQSNAAVIAWLSEQSKHPRT